MLYKWNVIDSSGRCFPAKTLTEAKYIIGCGEKGIKVLTFSLDKDGRAEQVLPIPPFTVREAEVGGIKPRKYSIRAARSKKSDKQPIIELDGVNLLRGSD